MTPDIARDWGLSFDDLLFLAALPEDACLEVALQLCHLRRTGRFAEDWSCISDDALLYVASQIEQPDARPHRSFDDRTARRYRVKLIEHLDLSRATAGDLAALKTWLLTEACPLGGSGAEMIQQSFLRFRDHGFIPPSEKALSRIVRSVRREFLDGYLVSVLNALAPETISKLESCLANPSEDHGFQRLKADVGAATLDNVLDAAERLEFIHSLALPFELLAHINPSWLATLTRRVEGETATEMRRHSKARRLGLFAIYLMSRRARMIDGLADLLLEVVHRIGTKSRRKVISRIAADIEKVHGKERLLVDIATAAMLTPNGRVADVIFPVATAVKLKAIIDEHRAKGTLDVRIQTIMRGSYASHYRRMLPSLLSVLEFHSNNETWRPILDALSLIVRLNEEGRRLVPESLAPEGSIPRKWRDTVVDQRGRLNVISFELCVLTQLRERIRAKEIWIAGADRYRNPDDDLPKDFPQKREVYYTRLNLTRDAKAFSGSVREQLEQELLQLNATMLSNEKVRIRWSGENRIGITPFDPVPEPKRLMTLKSEIGRRWPMTGLLDTLKETALETGFLDAFETSATRETLPRDVRDQRLLLCLYGLGTNAGLKRVAAGVPDVSYDELKCKTSDLI
ncbi:DUF4158 domain-containing protein [Yoonia sp. SS1-5]|uniref:DUF4158 domain-containing protein n=1 Tax=Yoonia rhodophyticola TaxID=3137370 RepID=A0AAN0M5P4_9RHOB